MKISSKNSSYLFIYPFQFNADEFYVRVDQLERAKWVGAKRDFNVWAMDKFQRKDLLPHVANYFNPTKEKVFLSAGIWVLTNEALHSTHGGLGAGKSNTIWYLKTSGINIPFLLISIRLILFRTGVGFLVVNAKPKVNGENYHEWLDFLHYFRFTQGNRNVDIQIHKQIGYDKENQKKLTEPFFPSCASESTEKHDGLGVFNDVIHGVLETAKLDNDTKPWWREVFIPGQLIPFVTLYVDGLHPDEQMPFLYRTRKFFHSKREYSPTKFDLDLENPFLLQYVDKQWFTYSLDGGCFIAFDAPDTDFFRNQLPNHITNQYFLIFLITLQQRFVLTALTEEVAKEWLLRISKDFNENNQNEIEASFEKIRDRILNFSALGHFSQATQRQNLHNYYLKWQDIFGVNKLFSEVNEEIRYIYEYLQEIREKKNQKLLQEERKRAKKFERRINLIALLFGPPAIGLAFLDAIANEKIEIAFGVLLGSMILGLILLKFLERK